MAMWPGRRRCIIVDNFTYRLLAVNLGYFFIILVILATTLFLPLIIQLKSGALSAIEKREVASQFLSLHSRVWLALVAVFALLAIHWVIVSNRIAGPLYRLRIILKAVTEGDLRVRATLRRNDYLQREADIINGMIAALRARITGIEKQSGEVRGGVAELRTAITGGSVEEIQQHIERLHAQVDRLTVSLDQFSTGAEETPGDSEGGALVSPVPGGDSASISHGEGHPGDTHATQSPR